MAAFGTLLRRFNERSSIVDERLELKAFRKKEAPVLEKAWGAWAYGQRALNRKEPQSSLVWLKEAQEALPEDLALRAEVSHAEGDDELARRLCLQVIKSHGRSEGFRRARALMSRLNRNEKQAQRQRVTR